MRVRIRPALLCLCTAVTHVATVAANVEKTIFLGPSPVAPPNDSPHLLPLLPLRLPALTPAAPRLPTQLAVRFPQHPAPRGLESWYLLRDLAPGQRYEARLCWPATVCPLPSHSPRPANMAQQPTDFWLDTYSLAHVLDSPALLSSLVHFGTHGQHASPRPAQPLQPGTAQAILLLRIQAAASYYSTNRTLMESPELVRVDIGAFPRLPYKVGV